MRKADHREGWWFRASTEQKLAQIDAAIELGMTAKQVAMNCGCLLEVHRDRSLVEAGNIGATVMNFAFLHGRKFDGQSEGKNKRTDVAFAVSIRKRMQKAGNITDQAYNIFGVKEHGDSLFDNYDAEA